MSLYDNILLTTMVNSFIKIFYLTIKMEHIVHSLCSLSCFSFTLQDSKDITAQHLALLPIFKLR